jgi:hypothetical protein
MKTSATVLVLLAFLALIPCTQCPAQAAQAAPAPAASAATAPVPAATADFLATLSVQGNAPSDLTPAPSFMTGCTSSAQCPKGQLCCYPCGIEGCSFTCMQPMNGHCPRIP